MINIDKDECCGCAACSAVCPKGCIKMNEDEEGFRYPLIIKTECVDCGLCEQVCPYINVKEQNVDTPLAFGVINNNEKQREYSSSGGFFPVIAEYFVSLGGIVYGAALSADCCYARHIRVDSIIDLKRIYGSKYLQSDISNVFVNVKNDLDEGKYVLFSGTPCQIAGLKGFLREAYIRLICVEVVCHGVPSAAVWRKYLCYIERKIGPKICKVIFRDKKTMRKIGGSIMYIENSSGKTYQAPSWLDPFYRLFLNNKILRPHCYRCKYKKTHMLADITLGDFWGINDINPEFGKEGDISLVILNTEKAKELFNRVKNQVVYFETNIEKALVGNPPYYESVQKHKDRERLFEELNCKRFNEIKCKYAKLNLKERIKVILVKFALYKL